MYFCRDGQGAAGSNSSSSDEGDSDSSSGHKRNRQQQDRQDGDDSSPGVEDGGKECFIFSTTILRRQDSHLRSC